VLSLSVDLTLRILERFTPVSRALRSAR